MAITQSEVETAFRFEFFLNGETAKAAPDNATLELVRDRVINQILLLKEADTDNLPATDSPDVSTEELTGIRKKFSNEEAFQAALKTAGMDERQVLERLSDRKRVLLFVDRRLRPSARVEPPEIETYYKNTFVPEYARRGHDLAPPLAAVESQIQEILAQKSMNQLLDKWLEDLKTSHRVAIHPY